MEKSVNIRISDEAYEVYSSLINDMHKSKINRSIINSIEHKKEILRQNPEYGNKLRKNLIPKRFIQEYGCTNLFRIELPNYWRMLYTLVAEEDNMVVIILIISISDHKTYSNLFNY